MKPDVSNTFINDDIVTYYAQRAEEYEIIYQKPERQDDICKLKDMLSSIFDGRDVLEIACGTGYWTQFIAESAKSILATDCNHKVIEIAQQKDYKDCEVCFKESDAYSLPNVNEEFDGGFCGFWWSHIPKHRIKKFIEIFHSKLKNCSVVVMMDNKYVEGSSTPISRKDEAGNTYQIRILQDGTKHEVLKNFVSEEELKAGLAGFARNIEYINLDHYWLVKYIA